MRKIFKGESYNGKDLSYSAKRNQGFYVEMLDSIECYLDYVNSTYKKVFFTMLVVRYPAGSIPDYYRNNNERFSKFLEALLIYFKRHKYKPLYFWAREESQSTGQFHYHLALIFDGNQIQNGYGVLDKATQLWAHYLGIKNGKGLIHRANTFKHYQYGGVKVDHNDELASEVHCMFFEWMSYLAKVYSKGGNPCHVNEYGCSRIPRVTKRSIR